MHVHEAFRRGLVVGVALVVGGEVEVVSDSALRRPLTAMCPPCNTIRISPVTCSWVSATNASSAGFSGEYQRPSYTSSPHL